MIILRNFDEYDDLQLFDKNSFSFTKLTNKLSVMHGKFWNFSTNTFAYFLEQQTLQIFINNNLYTVNSTFTLRHAALNDRERSLEIYISGKLIDTIRYEIDTSLLIEGDPAPFLEDDSFDFGLLLANIVNDNERVQVLVENLDSA